MVRFKADSELREEELTSKGVRDNGNPDGGRAQADAISLQSQGSLPGWMKNVPIALGNKDAAAAAIAATPALYLEGIQDGEKLYTRPKWLRRIAKE